MANSWIVTWLILVLVYDFSFSARLRKRQTHRGICKEPNPRNDCTCYVKGQKTLYKDGTPCYVLSEGYNGELDYKRGTCQKGKCEYNVIEQGCAHVQEEAKKKMKLGDQIGCAFTCYNSAMKKIEFGYYSEGAPCKHTVGAGNYTKGTCVKESGGKVLCKVPLALAC